MAKAKTTRFHMIPRNFLFLSHLDFNLLRFRLPIMQRLIAEGHRVYAVCPNGQVSDKFKEFGIIHINWNLIRDNKNPFHEISIVKQLTRIYNDIDPDLVAVDSTVLQVAQNV